MAASLFSLYLEVIITISLRITEQAEKNVINDRLDGIKRGTNKQRKFVMGVIPLDIKKATRYGAIEIASQSYRPFKLMRFRLVNWRSNTIPRGVFHPFWQTLVKINDMINLEGANEIHQAVNQKRQLHYWEI